MRFFVALFALLTILSSCGKNEQYETQITNLQDELKAMQEQMQAMQLSDNEKSKNELDATGIAIVDLGKVRKDYKGFIESDKRLISVKTRYENELKELGKQIQERELMIQQDAERFGEEFVKDDYQEYLKFRESAQQKSYELEGKLVKLENEYMRKVLDDVNAHSAKYAEANGYKMILFTAIENNIFYAEDNINITEEYIANLNNDYDSKN
ncbi:MAG: OmpH family outer membrane protein [Bacteroidia bacterium]